MLFLLEITDGDGDRRELHCSEGKILRRERTGETVYICNLEWVVATFVMEGGRERVGRGEKGGEGEGQVRRRDGDGRMWMDIDKCR